MKKSNFFWGLFFICAAALIIINQIGLFTYLRPVYLVMGIIFIYWILKSIPHGNFWGITFPLVGLYWVAERQFSFGFKVGLGPLLLAALFASIGLSIIFRKRPEDWVHWHHKRYEDYVEEGENMGDNSVYSKVSFSGATKYIHSNCLEKGEFLCSFGSTQVYFDQATLSPDGAEIYIDASFAGMELFVPHEWQVINNITPTLGGISFTKRRTNPEPDAPKLYLSGNVSFGGVEIKFV